MKTTNTESLRQRRRLISLSLLGGAVASQEVWVRPVVSAIVLPSHAQTSPAMCVVDATVGGPLAGHPSGASTCQAACEAEAADQGAELCDVVESVDASNAIQCECSLDLP